MCPQQKYMPFFIVCEFLFISIASLTWWMIYTTRLARGSCVDATRYGSNFFYVFNLRQYGAGRRGKDEFLFEIDERDVETLLRHRRMQEGGIGVIMLITISLVLLSGYVCRLN
jgi:hypothetical protein